MRVGHPDDRNAEVGWAVCGASVIGQEHQRKGLGCDDSFSYGVADDFIVTAVADGAGSVTGTSAWGSYVACQSVLANAMRSDFRESFRDCSPEHAERLMTWLFEKALKRVLRYAAESGLEPVLLSTTLCVALADRAQAVFGQIGDGVIAAESDGQIDTLLIEEKDDYANITSFLQSEGAMEDAFRTSVHRGVTAFGLSTDGMVYKITDVASGRAYEPFFRDSWRHVREGASAVQFASMLSSIEDDQTGDDKTVVLAALGPPVPRGSTRAGVIKNHSPAPDAAGSVEAGRSGDDVAPRTSTPASGEMVEAFASVPEGRRRLGFKRRDR